MAIYKNNTEIKNIYMVGHGLADPNATGLQEDVDYVRYEWLIGDGTAYIDTNVIVNVATLLISTKINRSNSTADSFIFGSRNIVSFKDPSTSSVVVMPQSFRCDIIDGNNIFDSSSIASIELSFPTLTINSQSLTTQRVPTTSQNTFRIFTTSVVNSETYCFNGGISGFVLNDGSHSLNLIPCRLLHSIPASLDANNKARQEGEYGMIDLVSKMFYGNVNSSGSFTGEGLIQKKVTFAFFGGKHVFGEMQEGVHIRRYGWLKGDFSHSGDGKRVNAIVLPIQSDIFDFYIKYQGSGSCVIVSTKKTLYYFDNNKIRLDLWKNNTLYQSITVPNTNLKRFTSNNSVAFYLDDTQIPKYESPITYASINAYESRVVISYSPISVDGSIRYTPCKLLKAIPAELDANGIARAAGVCGMYDEKNHKFYGNVNSDGTFTVEGMAEGYDYEVYTYLKGTGVCYIDTLINPAWNDQLSATTYVSGRPTVSNPYILDANGTNTKIAIVLGASWYTYNDPQFLVINKNVGTDDYFLCGSFPADAELYASFKVVNNSKPTVTFKVNGAVWNITSKPGDSTITELPDTTYKIGRDTSNGLDVLKLKNVKINSHNFMPCKLLRAIPAELDANGIARSADECGMVDTYTGLFYGNVNNNGAFTVEGGGLVEGYHYGVHQWLKGNNAIINTNITSVNRIKFTVDTSGTTNAVAIAYTHSSNEYAIQLEKNNIKAYFLGTSPNPLTFYVDGDRRQYTIDIDCVNGVLSIPETGQSGSKQFTTSFSYTHKFKLIQGFGLKDVFLDSMHLVPCKLLKSIPSKYDANGIARNAGECGMYDSVSGKFYGNVNSGGTFSVSNS